MTNGQLGSRDAARLVRSHFSVRHFIQNTKATANTMTATRLGAAPAYAIAATTAEVSKKTNKVS
jgi:hypothetical protein